MSDDVLIRVDGVSKKFCRDLKRSLWYGIQDAVYDLLGRDCSEQPLRADEFWAVSDVSFELKRGECLGLIGRNGAGKTTLLKMLNGLVKPDRGRIEMRGRVAALIALGAGFNPILTGRENLYVNGAVLGLSRKEINAKYDEIVDFAEIAEFVDAPVQSYSSGMRVRLGFAIATALEPDILLLDEVLAVGDAAFRIKCHRRISQMQKNAAVIFVSHEMAYVARICDQTLALAHGRTFYKGETEGGIHAYQALNESGREADGDSFIQHFAPLLSFDVDAVPKEVRFGEPFAAEFVLDSQSQIANVELRVTVYNMAGAIVADCIAENRSGIDVGRTRSRIEISSLPLRAGRYQLSFSITNAAGEFLAVSHNRHDIGITGGCAGTVADCQLHVKSWTTVDEREIYRPAGLLR
jgi:homopolymeric O-antigen transport system ATP-binding protein